MKIVSDALHATDHDDLTLLVMRDLSAVLNMVYLNILVDHIHRV